MLRRRLYYLIKPYTPWSVRMGLRRMFARRKRAECQAIWPIDETAKTAPAGWQGWPDGNKFAFVITHDVENETGLAKCRQLAELEMEMGFRSSFNFIPEGPYEVPATLRTWLTDNGFEVGVHDLAHDGKLFSSREDFREKAKRINHYLKTWHAVGFRAGFMLHELDWMHDLDVLYDASTFDTDPFEPMSDGARTIFPYWVLAPSTNQPPRGSMRPAEVAHSRHCYLELPYTLPQDSTLFLLFREKSSAIWLNKLDWIAKNGGMALVNVHPDYLCFNGDKLKASTFAVKHYADLLQHVRSKYGDMSWKALPRDVAQHCVTGRPNSQNQLS